MVHQIETYGPRDASLAEAFEAAETMLKLVARLRYASYEEIGIALDSVGR